MGDSINLQMLRNHFPESFIAQLRWDQRVRGLREDERAPAIVFKIATEAKWSHGPAGRNRGEIVSDDEHLVHSSVQSYRRPSRGLICGVRAFLRANDQNSV